MRWKSPTMASMTSWYERSPVQYSARVSGGEEAVKVASGHWTSRAAMVRRSM